MRTSSTRIRLTEKERNTLDELALKQSVSRSELIRQFIRIGENKNESAHVAKWNNETISTIRDCNMLIAKVGININQIAKRCNMGDTNITLGTEIQSMQQILDDMRKAVELSQ